MAGACCSGEGRSDGLEILFWGVGGMLVQTLSRETLGMYGGGAERALPPSVAPSTKQMLVDVIQCQPGGSLAEILRTPASELEVRWAQDAARERGAAPRPPPHGPRPTAPPHGPSPTARPHSPAPALRSCSR